MAGSDTPAPASRSAHASSLITKIRYALRGETTPGAALREACRRARVAVARRRERASLSRLRGAEPRARLAPEFAGMNAEEALEHFRSRAKPKFFAGFDDVVETARAQRELFPAETARLVENAQEIMRGRVALLGHGALEVGVEVDWLRDPVSGARWPLDFHADARLARGDGSDIRVVWELNRLGHVLALARAYAVTDDERYAAEVLRQARDWRAGNPVGFGPNWASAMEVALRAMNLFAALRLIRRSPRLDGASFALWLAIFDEHGAHIRRNLEFSYLTRGTHYLTNVAGLFWLGALLPELAAARAWREFGWRELLREMETQTLADGADDEASTSYHLFVTELFLYSFIIARRNQIEIAESHWLKLRSMLDYARACLRPDGRAPLIGDTDGGRVLPLAPRAADDFAYLLDIGALVFDEPRFQTGRTPPEEALWLLGEEGARKLSALRANSPAPASRVFPDAGACVMRAGDLYLHFNLCGVGLKGRGTHGHNDALSIEVAACGASFIRDPGTFVYTRDLRERHLFRSTAYHSTVEVDDAEQNTTDPGQPFRLGDEARPRLLKWESDEERDFAVAEHHGYARLARGAVTHRRSALFMKRERYWLIEDELMGAGEHAYRFVFHLAPETEARIMSDTRVEVCCHATGARLLIASLDDRGGATLEPRWSSRDYGAKQASQAACWQARAQAPFVARWALVPICAGEDEDERLSLIERLKRRQTSDVGR
jgi:hypothetical protein